MPIPAEDRPLPQSPATTRRVEYSTCYMCACRCGIQVTLEDDELRFIQGTRDHPVNQGVLCAKGSAGIMKQRSPAKLRKPLRRKPGALRGRNEFDEIEWDEALAIVEARLRAIRTTDPRKLAFFTGRDQMQALTGLWAQQFGTPNWAAHGGFCSVNMAAAGLYSIGFSFWEFGAPDWDRAKYFVLWGVAEDHSSNPIKIGLDKLKRNRAKFVSINPIRTGYSAIADEWLPIRPGTDGLLALAIVHVLLRDGTIDYEFLARYTNAPWLVVDAPGTSEHGLFARDGDGRPLVFDDALGQRDVGRRHCDGPRAVQDADARRRPACGHGDDARGRTVTSATITRRPRSPSAAALPPTRSSVSRAKWRMSRSRRRSSCRSHGPTCGDAITTRSSGGRLRCTRCAGSPRIRTGSRRAVRCICCRCCSARSTAPAISGRVRRTRSPSRRTSCRRPPALPASR